MAQVSRRAGFRDLGRRARPHLRGDARRAARGGPGRRGNPREGDATDDAADLGPQDYLVVALKANP